MNLNEMSKKEFKSYINKKGFFLNFNATKVEDIEAELKENKGKIMGKMPKGENFMLFKGIASQNYGKGEKSRNGYKIDQKGRDLNDYKSNPIILLQHNHEYGGIGHSIRIGHDEVGNLTNMFYVDLNTLDEKTRYQVENGYITATSTSHLTVEDMIEENKTGKRMTREEASEKGVDLRGVMFGTNDDYTLVVTKAKMIENSLVTIGSNEKAIAHNSINNYFINKALDSDFLSLNKEMAEKIMNENIPEEIKVKINKIKDLEENKRDDKKEEEKKDEKVEDKKEEEKKVEDKKEEEKKVEDKKEEKEKEKEKSPENGDNEDKKPEKTPIVKISKDENFLKMENRIKQLENQLSEEKKGFDEQINDTIKVVSMLIDSVGSIKKNLKSIVVNGVSTYTNKEEVTSNDNKLRGILEKAKNQM